MSSLEYSPRPARRSARSAVRSSLGLIAAGNVLAGQVLHVDHVMEVVSGNRMMVNVPPLAACPLYRNGITWRVVGLADQVDEPPGPLDEDVAAGS